MPSESGRMTINDWNICSFISSICLNVISLLITLALQRSLQATITTARKTYYFTFRLIFNCPNIFIQMLKTHTQTQPYSQTMHIVFQRKSVLSVFAILVDGASIYSHQTRNTQNFSPPHICNQQYTIHWLTIHWLMLSTWPALMWHPLATILVVRETLQTQSVSADKPPVYLGKRYDIVTALK